MKKEYRSVLLMNCIWSIEIFQLPVAITQRVQFPLSTHHLKLWKWVVDENEDILATLLVSALLIFKLTNTDFEYSTPTYNLKNVFFPGPVSASSSSIYPLDPLHCFFHILSSPAFNGIIKKNNEDRKLRENQDGEGRLRRRSGVKWRVREEAEDVLKRTPHGLQIPQSTIQLA